MSPTAATLKLAFGRLIGICVGRTGFGGAEDGTGACDSLAGDGVSGVLLQADITTRSGGNHHKRVQASASVTKTNSDNVDVGLVQPAAHHVELVQVGDRADAHAMVGAIINRHALDHGFDSV